MKPRATAIVLCAAIAYCTLAAVLAGRHLSEPGLYYDEVIQAGPALEFLREGGEPFRVPGQRATRFFGRWLPWMTQPYMGALKSQLLIPFFALATPDAALLRGITLGWALLGIPLVMLFANRALGLSFSLVVGALLAADPGLLFLGRHDWGSFSLGFLLRGAALALLYGGLRSRSLAAIAAGGACLGLGLYNKIDFGITLAAAGVALVIVAPRAPWRWFREQRGRAWALLGGFALGVAPLAVAAGGVVSVASAATRGGSLAGEWSEKLLVLRAVLDGSYFQRLMLAGGRFDELGVAAGATPGLGFESFALAVLIVAVFVLLDRPRSSGDRMRLWIVGTALLSLVGVLLTPRAVRAHHFLNAVPFPQLAVAVAATLLWDRGARIARIPARIAAVVLVLATLSGSVRLDLETVRMLRETGGRGRWSHAVEDLARKLPPDAQVVSLDWGFDGPLRFVAPGLQTDEPIWRLRRPGITRLSGSVDHIYLLYEADLAVFPYGAALLEAIAGLPPDVGIVTAHVDREGAPVFRSVRFARPHELVYRGGEFSVELQ